jgi:hypothetical protein
MITIVKVISLITILVLSIQTVRSQNPIVRTPNILPNSIEHRTGSDESGHSSIFVVQLAETLKLLDTKFKLKDKGIKFSLVTIDSAINKLLLDKNGNYSATSKSIHSINSKSVIDLLDTSLPLDSLIEKITDKDSAIVAIKLPDNANYTCIPFDLANIWSEHEAYTQTLLAIKEYFEIQNMFKSLKNDSELTLLDTIDEYLSTARRVANSIGDYHFSRALNKWKWFLLNDHKTITRLFTGKFGDSLTALNNAGVNANFKNGTLTYTELAAGACGPLWLSLGSMFSGNSLDTNISAEALIAAQTNQLVQSIIYGGGTFVMNITMPIAGYFSETGFGTVGLLNSRAAVDIQGVAGLTTSFASALFDMNLDWMIFLRSGNSFDASCRLRAYAVVADKIQAEILSGNNSVLSAMFSATVDVRFRSLELHISQAFLTNSSSPPATTVGIRVSR